jgi:protease-4
VAILYANGDIVDGEGTDDKIYGYTFARSVREVADDDDIKAVVVRVNSPGGSALASDISWREMELLKAKKPVIVSMGSYAASGGYYISAPADAIVADRLTLTGSIGVFGMIPNFGKALEKNAGITFDEVSTNKHAGMGRGFRAMSSTEYKAIMQGVDRVYERFTSLVAEGRNLTIEKVLEIAEGRVWSGAQAQQIGLVDTCGGLNAALAIAVDKAELGDNFQIVEHTEPLTGFMAIFQNMSGSVRQAILSRSEFGEFYNDYQQFKQMVGTKGIYTRCPYIYRFE